MDHLKLILEYDGSCYHGWQRQPRHPTVQGILENILGKISGGRIKVTGAGRTDAGVHAEGQVASFSSVMRLKPDQWRRAINRLLPEDIRVVSARKVPGAFHARYSAVGKIYRYRIFNHPTPRAIGRQYVWTVYKRMNLNRMRVAGRAFLGRKDFRSLKAAGPIRSDTVCRIRRLEIFRKGKEIWIEVEADRFLKQMVRTIVGTLVEVGLGKRRPDEMKPLILGKDRRFLGPTAPARGLCLIRVRYRGDRR